MAKMALADNVIDQSERDMLEQFCSASCSGLGIDAALDQARTSKVDELAAHVTRYADRFFVALRAYMMATVDSEVHEAELKLYRHLLESFSIPRDDQELIRRTALDMHSTEPAEPDPRIHDLFQKSSFAG